MDVTCEDCGYRGHKSSKYYKCPKFDPASQPQSEGGKAGSAHPAAERTGPAGGRGGRPPAAGGRGHFHKKPRYAKGSLETALQPVQALLAAAQLQHSPLHGATHEGVQGTAGTIQPGASPSGAILKESGNALHAQGTTTTVIADLPVMHTQHPQNPPAHPVPPTKPPAHPVAHPYPITKQYRSNRKTARLPATPTDQNTDQNPNSVTDRQTENLPDHLPDRQTDSQNTLKPQQNPKRTPAKRTTQKETNRTTPDPVNSRHLVTCRGFRHYPKSGFSQTAQN